MEELKLKPMDIGDILDKSFRLYKKNFLKFVHIMAPIYILSFLSGVIYQQAVVDLGIRGPAGIGVGLIGMGVGAIFGLIFVILRFLAIGALVYSVSGSYLGKDIIYKGAYDNVWKQFWPLVGVGILCGIMTTIGFYMLIIPGIVLSVFLSLVVQVMVLEKEGVGRSIGRSFELVAYCFWKAFLVCFVAYMIVLMASGVAYLPFLVWAFIRGFLNETNPQMPLMVQIFQLAISNFVQLLTAPFWMIALTLLYYDIRIRKEGFDLEIMAHNLGYEASREQENPQSHIEN